MELGTLRHVGPPRSEKQRWVTCDAEPSGISEVRGRMRANSSRWTTGTQGNATSNCKGVARMRVARGREDYRSTDQGGRQLIWNGSLGYEFFKTRGATILRD